MLSSLLTQFAGTWVLPACGGTRTHQTRPRNVQCPLQGAHTASCAVYRLVCNPLRLHVLSPRERGCVWARACVAAGIRTTDSEEMIARWCQLMNVTREEALFYLSAASFNLEVALNLYLDAQAAAAAGSTGASPFAPRPPPATDIPKTAAEEEQALAAAIAESAEWAAITAVAQDDSQPMHEFDALETGSSSSSGHALNAWLAPTAASAPGFGATPFANPMLGHTAFPAPAPAAAPAAPYVMHPPAWGTPAAPAFSFHTAPAPAPAPAASPFSLAAPTLAFSPFPPAAVPAPAPAPAPAGFSMAPQTLAWPRPHQP